MGRYNHGTALLIKFAAVAVIAAIALPAISTMNLTQSLITAAALAAVTYIVGDLLILPNTNNTATSIADAGLTFIVVWMLNFLLTKAPIDLTGLLLVSLVIGAAEYFFHKYAVLTAAEQGEPLPEGPKEEE